MSLEYPWMIAPVFVRIVLHDFNSVLFLSGCFGGVCNLGLSLNNVVVACCIQVVEILHHVDQPGVEALTYSYGAIQFLWPLISRQAPLLEGLLEDHL